MRRSGCAAIALAGLLAGGCGGATGRTAHVARAAHIARPARAVVRSQNYAADGAYLGEPVSPAGRMCGYTTWHGDTASLVVVRGIDCARAAGLIRSFLAAGQRAPSGWSAATQALTPAPPGGPPGASEVREKFLVWRGPSGVTGMLSPGTGAPPPPLIGPGSSEVHFGCPTASAICR